MKKIITLLLAAAMLLSLVSCKEEKTESKKEKLYKKYSDIIEYLEEENYQAAINEIDKLSRGESPEGDGGDNTEDEPSEDEKRWAALLVGDWMADESAAEDGYSDLVFREDGSCTVNGEEYTWEMPSDSVSSTHASIDVSRDGVSKYRFTLRHEGNYGFREIAGYTQNSDGGSTPINGYFYCTDEYNAIELTVDNWQNYFEIEEVITTVENSFGEVERLNVTNYLRLKDEYMPINRRISDVAIEISCVSRCYDVEVDLSTLTYEIVGEEKNSTDPQKSTDELGFYDLSDGRRIYGDSLGSFTVYDLTEDNVGTAWITSDIEVVRIQGVIYSQIK